MGKRDQTLKAFSRFFALQTQTVWFVQTKLCKSLDFLYFKTLNQMRLFFLLFQNLRKVAIADIFKNKQFCFENLYNFCCKL